jgi:hypothetical protein
VQVQTVWDALNQDEQGLVDVAVEAAERLLLVGGDVNLALRWSCLSGTPWCSPPTT